MNLVLYAGITRWIRCIKSLIFYNIYMKETLRTCIYNFPDDFYYFIKKNSPCIYYTPYIFSYFNVSLGFRLPLIFIFRPGYMQKNVEYA